MRTSAIGVLLFAVTGAGAQTPCDEPLAARMQTVSLPAQPFGVAVSNDGCHIFVSLMAERGGGGSVAVLRRTAGRVELIRAFPMPERMAGIVLTHDGRLVIAAALNRILFLDTACLLSGCEKPVLGSFSDGNRMQSIYANVTADDKLLFVSEESGAAITVIDLARARKAGFAPSAIIGKIPVGWAPIALTFSPDGRWLYTTSQGAPPEWGWPAACKPENRPSVKS